jgi:hypothetical protein
MPPSSARIGAAVMMIEELLDPRRIDGLLTGTEVRPAPA